MSLADERRATWSEGQVRTLTWWKSQLRDAAGTAAVDPPKFVEVTPARVSSGEVDHETIDLLSVGHHGALDLGGQDPRGGCRHGAERGILRRCSLDLSPSR